MMTGSSKNNRKIIREKCFRTQEKETWVTFNAGLSAKLPSNKKADFSWFKGFAYSEN